MAPLTRVGTGNREQGTEAIRSELAVNGSHFPVPPAPRADFPILSTRVHGGEAPLIYLDNAATTQKPRAVIDATMRYYAAENANIHRGVHWLSQQATAAYDRVREQARAFLGAEHSHEVIFTHGATEGINLVASSYGEMFVGAGDEILVSELEHHSNLVPWQLMTARKGARVRAIPLTAQGELDMNAFVDLLGPQTKLVAITQLSNVLGTINPIAEIVSLAHARGVPVLVDGAQSASRMPVNVRELGCDFFVCSGHKMYGPTGTGLLYGRTEWLDRMPPYNGGGDMIDEVDIACSTYAPLPAKFEAGTPNIAGVVGLGVALGWIEAIGREQIAEYEDALVRYAVERLEAIGGVSIVGAPKVRAGVVSFVMEGVHPHDIGTILDTRGIAIRGGHHCAQPLMRRLGVPATARASFAVYNTFEEIDALAAGVEEVGRVFGPVILSEAKDPSRDGHERRDPSLRSG